MKRLFLLILCSFSSVYCSYSGNPASPAILKIGLFNNTPSIFTLTSGYVGDYTHDKHMEFNTESDEIQNIDVIGLESNFGNFTLNLLERIEIYGMFGTSKASIDWASQEHNVIDSDAFTDGKTNNHFSWRSGARVILLQWSDLAFGLGFCYFDIPVLKQTSSIFKPMESQFALGPQYFKLKEWQVDCGFALRVGPFIPYIGVQYLHSRFHVLGETESIDYKNSSNLGLFLGSSMNILNKVSLTAEARVFSENAISFEASFAF